LTVIWPDAIAMITQGLVIPVFQPPLIDGG
jgi:hypothetical protein